MESTNESLFDKAMSRYQSGESASSLLKDFEQITTSMPNHSAGWTCLSWLQLLCDQYDLAAFYKTRYSIMF